MWYLVVTWWRLLCCRLREEEAEWQVANGALQTTVTERDARIAAQDRRIHALDGANARLLAALNQLKEKRQRPSALLPPKLKLAADNGQFKSSSC